MANHGTPMTKNQILAQLTLLQQNIDLLKQMVIALQEDEHTENALSAVSDSSTPLNLTTPEDIVAQMLHAASFVEESTRETLLSQVLHSSILKHSPALDSFMRFSFRTLQGRWQDYLRDPSDFSSFSITRQQRNDRGELSDLKVYLEATNRSPCPITFQQDPYADMNWKVISSSL
jgi:hypothetical protein